ncbi:hypothetical protein LCIT_03180 [Leuconostoc citreum]|uniref:DUF2829 domain-containing protein n=1 Tax=Leuconostoc citreum TaxID=33964 RepID=A0A5A5TZ54_LEUCI|nr:hypothetical protein [Leuconostoc citreum]GDZ83076.1 hypothetical protein LCIT_03180 [Leuconostoc citreum]
MNIIGATKKALKEGKAISSYKANYNTVLFVPQNLDSTWLIIDTEGVVAMSQYGWPASWNPKPSDFLNDDWQVVEYNKTAIKKRH